MNKKYFTIYCLSTHHRGYGLWFCNDVEGVVTLDNRFVLFHTVEELFVFTDTHHIIVEKASTPHYHLKRIEQWIEQPRKKTIKPKLFLNVWNFFTDIATSTQSTFEEQIPETALVYQKLFAANNLPSINTTNTQYIPRWTKKEVCVLQEVLRAGMSLFDTTSFYFNQ